MRSVIGLLVVVFVCLPSVTTACHNSSTEMYRCLHLFLERDFYLVQDLFNFQPRDFRQARFRLDAMELNQLCDHIKEMEHCYQQQLPSCYTFPFHMNLLRIVNSLHGVHRILCGNGTDALKELITHGHCIENYRKTNMNCDHEFHYNYPLIFLKIARFQVGGSICRPLIKFRQCLIDPLMNQCDQRAMTIWNQTLATVERGFCYRQQYVSTCRPLHSVHHLIIISFVSFVLLAFSNALRVI